MRGDPGLIVTTGAGNLGRTRNRDHFVNGKVIVYLLDENYNPILKEDGKEKSVLADRSKIKVTGRID